MNEEQSKPDELLECYAPWRWLTMGSEDAPWFQMTLADDTSPKAEMSKTRNVIGPEDQPNGQAQ